MKYFSDPNGDVIILILIHKNKSSENKKIKLSTFTKASETYTKYRKTRTLK